MYFFVYIYCANMKNIVNYTFSKKIHKPLEILTKWFIINKQFFLKGNDVRSDKIKECLLKTALISMILRISW